MEWRCLEAGFSSSDEDRVVEIQNRVYDLIKKDEDPTHGLLYGFFENFNSEKTKIAYKKDLKQFFDFLKENGRSFVVTKIKVEHAVSFRNHLNDLELKDSTINRKISSCSAFWKYLFKREIVPKNIFEFVDRNKIANISKTRALENEEISCLLQAWTGVAYNEALYNAVLHVFFYTGIRKAELQSLKVKDLKKYPSFCSLIIKAKGGEVAEQRLNDLATEALVKYLEVRINTFESLDEEDFLFVSSKNTGQISATLIDYIFKKTGEYTGVGSWITPHVARASFISHLLDKHPVQKVSKEVRHKDIKTTLGYYNRIQKVENSLVGDITY